MSELTGLFALAGNGDVQAFDRIFTLLYPDLAAMARARLRKGERVTLADTGALVHESWLRLQRAGSLEFADRNHFLAHAARVMRSVIVDKSCPRAEALPPSGASAIEGKSAGADQRRSGPGIRR